MATVAVVPFDPEREGVSQVPRAGLVGREREELKVDALLLLARTTTPATHSQPSEDPTRVLEVLNSDYELGDDDNACCWALEVSYRLIAELNLIPLSYFQNPAH